MKKISMLVITVLLLSAFSLAGWSQDRNERSVAAMSPIELLPGYRMNWVPGIDTAGGTISKTSGIRIYVLLSGGSASQADLVAAKDVVWREDQVVNGRRVICVFTKSNDLVISFPQQVANFRAHIRNQQDLAEMLLMVLTYDPAHGYPAESAPN